MKAIKLTVFGLANVMAVLAVLSFVNHNNMIKKYGDRFRPNSFIMSDSVILNADVSEIYQFYIHHYDEVYAKTAAKHHEFKLLNSDSITEGTRIYCVEGEENERLYHDYVVRKVIPNQLIYKSSEPSIVKIKSDAGTRENHCNAFVYVDFKDLKAYKTQVKFTIIVQMPNYFYKLIGRLVGGRKAKEEWESHLEEELVGFRNEYYAKKISNNKKNS